MGVSAPSSQAENRVEAGVGLAEWWIIAEMELERTPMARDFDHLNELVKAKLEELNNAPFTAIARFNSRRQMFEKMKNASSLAAYRAKLSVYWISASLSLIVAIAFAYQVMVIATARRRSTPASAFP